MGRRRGVRCHGAYERARRVQEGGERRHGGRLAVAALRETEQQNARARERDAARGEPLGEAVHDGVVVRRGSGGRCGDITFRHGRI
ncbi:hypothetical protein STTU_1747 [Streptomyces sp. Tu6071]|nr:hypothetical protein STTU_1747 [Streptomyces sp. Tu6071]